MIGRLFLDHNYRVKHGLTREGAKSYTARHNEALFRSPHHAPMVLYGAGVV